MFCFLLLVSKMGMLAAQLNGTEQTVTVSKNFTDPPSITKNVCSRRCNITCSLSNQSLEDFPACVPITVQELDLTFNQLTVISHQDVADLYELRILSLAHNEIKEIMWGNNVLAQLESLDLSYNHLSVVPACVMLKKVKWLSLAGNPMHNIPSLACFPNLVFLNLSSTLLGYESSADIDESAFPVNETQKDPLTSLHLLDLSDTFLYRIKETWSRTFPNLRTLYMRKMNNMESLEDELLEWFPQLQVLNCDGSHKLTRVRTEIFSNASQLNLSFQNCTLTSFPPWNITSGSVAIDLRGNPLVCDCELINWLLSDDGHISLLWANETYCNVPNVDMQSIPSISGYRNFCKVDQINPSPSAVQDFSMATPTNGISVTGTLKVSVTATPTSQTMEQKPYFPHSVTVFKTSAGDSTVLSPKAETSSDIYEAITPDTGNDPDKGSTISMNSSGGPSTDSKYITAPTLLTTEFFSSTKAGSGQPIAEDSSIGGQASIPLGYSEDYDDEESQPERSTIPITMSPCDYDSCKHLQTPCTELQQQAPCLCPGLSGEDTVPDQPYLKNLSEITDTSAQIHWCSPNSVVEKYQLVYQSGGQNKTVDNIYVAMRQYTLYNLSPYTTYKVCMVASNKRGQSETENMDSRISCAEFKTRPSYTMILAVLSGLVGLFLVTITVLAACLYKACKNNMVNQYDTHLVSYKNPAFEYHLTIPSYH